MKTLIIENKKIYQPKNHQEVKELHNTVDKNITIDLIELEIQEELLWHSEHGMIVGSILELAKYKNVVIITTNLAVEAVLNSMIRS